MKIKQKTIVLMITTLLIFSASFIFVEARSNEKIKVLIGFNAEMQPDLIRSYGGKIDHEIGIANAIATTLPERAIQALENNPNIAYIELDQIVYILEDRLDWGVDRIDAELVWGGSEDATSVTGNAGAGVNVMILDTGIDYNHIELDYNYKGGTDIINGDNDPMDDHWHGTHCAGIVAAEDNGIGIIGVAPKVNLYAVKVLNSGGRGYLSDVAAGIDWAVRNEADVISMSLGGTGSDSTLENACNNAYSQGVVLVAAAGNSGNPPGRGDNVEYPARYSSVIAVASTDSNNKRARSSSTGPDVELAAPGVDIQSTYPGNYLATASGTSMACPHVAGVAALIIASDLNVNVRDQLTSTAEDLGNAGRDTHYGYGLVDAEAAAGGSEPPDTTPPAQVTGLSANAVSSSQINLAWDANTEGDIDYYNIYRDGDVTPIGTTTATSYSDSGLSASTTYIYTVSAVDTSGNEGLKSTSASATTDESSGSGIALSATGYKVKGRHHIDLTWSGATSTNVDIYRDGAMIQTIANDGFYTDNTGNVGGGSYTYYIYEEGTEISSNTVTVTF